MQQLFWCFETIQSYFKFGKLIYAPINVKPAAGGGGGEAGHRAGF